MTAPERIKAMPGYLNGYNEEMEADQHHAYMVGFADAVRSLPPVDAPPPDWEPTAERLLSVLTAERERFMDAANTAPKTHSGTGSWWELSGYVDILGDALKRIYNGRQRVEANDRRLALPPAPSGGDTEKEKH